MVEYFLHMSARYMFLIGSLSTARPVPDYAKSSLYVARHQITAVDGDLELVGQAGELLKKVKAMIVAKAKTEQTMVAKEVLPDASQPVAEQVTDLEAGNGPPMPTD
jgi:hypothetical protein